MSAPPDSLEIGKCCLLGTGHVRRVMRLKPFGVFDLKAALSISAAREYGGWGWRTFTPSPS